MMNFKSLVIGTLILAGLTGAGPARTQSAGNGLPPELVACAAETDVARRLACFDREMAKLQRAPDPAPEPAPEPVAAPATEPVAVPAEEPVVTTVTEPVAAPAGETVVTTVTEPVAAAAGETVVTAVTEPVAAPAAEPDEDFGLPDAGPSEFSATVADITRRPRGELIVLLDNGQIWAQKHQDNRFRLAVGEQVTISEGLISGYRLTAGDRNNSIQVERLK